MPKQLRITRNAESSELVQHIRDDSAMMIALRNALQEFWQHYKADFASMGRSAWDPSPLLIPPTADLIIVLIEQKVDALKTAPHFRRAAGELDALAKKASLYPVADEILQLCLRDYCPMAKTGQFEVVDEVALTPKPWWKFW